jgi:hypothetical protein
MAVSLKDNNWIFSLRIKLHALLFSDIARCSSGSPYTSRQKRHVMARRRSVYNRESEQGTGTERVARFFRVQHTKTVKYRQH